uniref:Uncharacterized protein n=1 Tax=Octopus bimaculoides TaxID=37653 RepID=A0A0L8FRI1_OCTBM
MLSNRRHRWIICPNPLFSIHLCLPFFILFLFCCQTIDSTIYQSVNDVSLFQFSLHEFLP